MPAHDWTVEFPGEWDDPTERVTHCCIRCGVRRDSEWGTLPTYWRRQVVGDVVSHEGLGHEEPPCG